MTELDRHMTALRAQFAYPEKLRGFQATYGRRELLALVDRIEADDASLTGGGYHVHLGRVEREGKPRGRRRREPDGRAAADHRRALRGCRSPRRRPEGHGGGEPHGVPMSRRGMRPSPGDATSGRRADTRSFICR